MRKECQALGINPSTGVVKDIATRCLIYRERIDEYYESRKVADEAKERNDRRAEVHKYEKRRLKEHAHAMGSRLSWDACHMHACDKVIQLARRGMNPNEESPRGLTPLITLVLNEASLEQIEELLSCKAHVNAVNRFGLTALMVAARRKDTKMIHALMRNGASAVQCSNAAGKLRTVLHWCAVHGSEEVVKIIIEYLREGVGDLMRVVRFLDAAAFEGETALMTAARMRNPAMCHVIASSGASPSLLDAKGKSAAYHARQAGWKEIADWMEKKVGAGVAKLETHSDLVFERQARFGVIKMRDLINKFGDVYLTAVQNKVAL